MYNYARTIGQEVRSNHVAATLEASKQIRISLAYRVIYIQHLVKLL